MVIFSAKVNNFNITTLANMPDIIFFNLTAWHIQQHWKMEEIGCKYRDKYEKGEEIKKKQKTTEEI